MRTTRILTTAAVAAGVLAAPLAHAATPKPVCDLVTDPSGDVIPSTPGVDNGDYDIRSADVATDARKLTAVIRLSSLAPEDTASPAARDYEFDFVANGHAFGLEANLLTGGVNFEAVVYDTTAAGSRSGTDLGAVTGVVDAKHHEIRITAPLSLFAPYASFKQTYVDQLAASSARAVGQDGVTSPDGRVAVGAQSTALVVDDASSNARYTPGQRSCVRVGK
jgi:hypothetical protein